MTAARVLIDQEPAAGPSETLVAATVAGVVKRFPGVVALDGVSLDINRGEVHALLGENGAGKSTLIKVLTGTYRADEGQILIGGREMSVSDPHQASRLGVALVPQEVLAVPDMPIGRSILLGRERLWTTRTSLTTTDRARAQEALDRIGADYGPDVLARDLSVPQLRLAQLARALSTECTVLVLDEPTAALNEHDSELLLQRIDMARSAGAGVLYVTHRLSEVTRIADRVTVLRDGKVVGGFAKGDVDRDAIIDLLAKDVPRGAVATDRDRVAVDRSGHPPVICARGLDDGAQLFGVDLVARVGEIIGVAGVQGSGHGQLARVLGGLAKASGSLEIDGRAHKLEGRRSTFGAGVAVVPGDRRNAGIVGPLSIADNIALSSRIRRSARRFGLRWRRNELAMTRGHITRLSIRPASAAARVGQLSGGNQQKVAIARALEGCPRVLVVEEPTQGIDINAKAEVRRLLQEFAGDGGTVVVATSEFEELIGLADHTYVMCSGRVAGELAMEETTYRNILQHAIA